MSLGRNVLKLTTSTIASSAILFATTPIVARMFAPEDFGIYQIFMSIMTVLGVVSCCGYELSIPLGKNDKEAIASFALSAIILLIFSLLVLTIIPLVNSQVAVWFKSPNLEMFLWLLPIAILIGSLQKSLQYWAAYKMQFGIMAWAGFVSAVVGGLTPIGWYFIYGRSPAGLLASIFTGGTAAILIFLIPSFRVLIAGFKEGGFRLIIDVAKYHKKFPIFSIWSELLNNVSVQLPPIIFGLYFSTTEVGYYSLGRRLISLPMSLLGGSIAQVFFPTAAKEYNETGTLSKIVSNVFRILVQIGVFPLVAIGFLGALLFGFVFGPKWIEAGVYAQILAVWYFLMFISSPLGTVFPILNRQGTKLLLNILIILGRTASLMIGATIFSPRGTLGVFVAFSVLAVIGFIILILRLSNVSVLWATKTILKYIVFSSILIFPVKFISWIAGDLSVVLATIFATMLYIIVLLKIEPSFRQFLLQFLANLRARKYKR